MNPYDNPNYFIEEAEKFKLPNFIRYLFGAGIKITISLFLLWFFIDYLKAEHRTLTRLIISLFVFIATYFLYKKIGLFK